MPRVHSSQRQKNKPFKNKKSEGSKSKSKQAKVGKTKPISKSAPKKIKSGNKAEYSTKHKKQKSVQKLTSQNEYLDSVTKQIVANKLKSQAEMKIVVLVPGNKNANTTIVLQKIYELVNRSEGFVCKANLPKIPYNSLEIIPSSKSFIRNKLLIISGKRNSQQSFNLLGFHDLIKCADIICPILSCKQTNTQGMNLDPHAEGKAFDEEGYMMLNMIRSLGTPTTIGIIQDINEHKPKHHDKIEKLFKRFICSELSENDKITCIKGEQDYNKILRQMDSTPIITQNWKSQRGYMLVENMTLDEKSNNVTFHGFLKGNCVNATQLVHVTGFDNYEIQKIQIHHQNKAHRSQMEEEKNLIQFGYKHSEDELYPFAKKEEYNEDLLSALDGLKLQNEEKKEKKGEMSDEDDRSEDYEDQSDSEEECDMEEYFGNKEEEKAKRIEMQMRKEDELQFQDEVQYAAQQDLRQKYKEYQGLKNFKTSDWNCLQNLPDAYDRIFTFKNYQKISKVVRQENMNKGYAYPGFYISVTIVNFPIQKLQSNDSPIILSFMLKHEQKMTQLHLKVKRNPYYPANDTVIQSNHQYLVMMGFRRFVTRPIFSKVINGSTKTKFVKKITEDYESHYFCSFYHYNYFPPAPAQVFRLNQFNLQEHEPSPVMYGELVKCDPLHIILERIILTGYPFKINRRRATVRFMFFNPKDVKYFKPIEVRSREGKKGRIEESLGMHGYMKVLFNDKVHQNDTVCMNLYRRVYPQPYF